MKYLITGGTGLIGKALIERLLRHNASITVLTRNIKKAEQVFSHRVLCIDDLSIEHIESSDVIINLAGEAIADKRWTSQQKNKICQSRWRITQQITNLVKQAQTPPRLLISGSAIGMYGRQAEQAIDDDYQDFNQEFTHHVCTTWENIASNAASEKTRVALLRTGVVLTKDGGALSKMLLPYKLGLGGKIGSGEQIMSWIHLDDVVAAILHIEQNKQLKGAINITAPFAVTNQAFSQALTGQLKRPCIFTTPSWLLKTLLGEMSDLLLFGQNVVPKKLIDSNFSFRYPTINQAFKHLLSR